MSQAPQAEGVSTSRLETLTDGVFAIVMMLLVFDLKVPSAAEVTPAQELNRVLVALLPNLFALIVLSLLEMNPRGALWTTG